MGWGGCSNAAGLSASKPYHAHASAGQRMHLHPSTKLTVNRLQPPHQQTPTLCTTTNRRVLLRPRAAPAGVMGGVSMPLPPRLPMPLKLVTPAGVRRGLNSGGQTAAGAGCEELAQQGARAMAGGRRRHAWAGGTAMCGRGRRAAKPYHALTALPHAAAPSNAAALPSPLPRPPRPKPARLTCVADRTDGSSGGVLPLRMLPMLPMACRPAAACACW